jgi:fimbrial chaperone protein
MSTFTTLAYRLALPMLSLLGSATACAQATFLIWPIYPKIEAQEKATAVWLENTGKDDAMVQIRVFKWQQQHYQDQYQAQNEVIPSPPIAKIKAGEKYMLRLTRPAAAPDHSEIAYRIIVDELPIQLNSPQATLPKVNFQMRYSIPLFSYGQGLGSGLTEASLAENRQNQLAQPILSYWLESDGNGKTQLYIQNKGLKFARLTGVQLQHGAPQINFENIAFGYILSNSTMHFDLSQTEAEKLRKAEKLYGQDSSGSSVQLIEIQKNIR